MIEKLDNASALNEARLRVAVADVAAAEARRCLLCSDAPCSCGCPAGVNPGRFIRHIRFGNMSGAVRELKKANVLAASCSYICPCLGTCMGKCTSEKLTKPIDIIGLQRFVCDWERTNGLIEPLASAKTGAKVAIIGSGPAGLACAAELCSLNHVPVIFDSCNQAGGMLRQVIPDFRLPPEVLDLEIEFVKKLGAEFVLGSKIDDIDKLFADGFKAVFISSGVGASKEIGINGHDKHNVHQALKFLKDSKSDPSCLAEMKGKRVAVVGGGDTAIDAARVSARAGAHVTMIYRRTRQDMPAYRPDISLAEDEGVELAFRTLPRSIIGTEAVQGVRAVHVRWQGKGRSSNDYLVEGNEFLIPCEVAIFATGQVPEGMFGLRTSPSGYIAVDHNFMTFRAGVFAGGDIVSGPSTAVAAVGSGRLAAAKIDEYLKKK